MTWSPCVAVSKQKSQGFCNSNYWIRAWQHWIKVRVPLRKTSFWWIEACNNWSKNNFSEIQISQGLDWRFPPWHIFLSWPPPSTNDVIWTDQEGKVEEKTWKLHSFLNGYTDTREPKQPQLQWQQDHTRKNKNNCFSSGQDSVQSCGANQKSELGGVTGLIENEIRGCSAEFLPNLITAVYAI